MNNSASYFALFFALGALIGFLCGYLYRGRSRQPVATPPGQPEQIPTSSELPADTQIGELPGMTEALAARLAAAGAPDLDALRQIGASNAKLAALADTLRVEDFTVRRWVALAGLRGIDEVDADLANALLRVGIRSAKDLAGANADRIQNKLLALNEAESLPADVPTRQQVVDLIERAAASD